MNFVIRAAIPGDAAAIAVVARDVWPEEPLDASVIGRLLGQTERATAVAELHGRMVGFVDGFMTRTAQGDPRWEVDLLAVSPHAHGQGLGRALVRASVDAAIDAGAAILRALIRQGNVASERVFAACGFTPDAGMSQLWIADNLSLSHAEPGMHVVRVRTFRYDGIWLEAVNPDALGALRAGGSTGVTGAVISSDDQESLTMAAEVGMKRDGDFRFWHRSAAGYGRRAT